MSSKTPQEADEPGPARPPEGGPTQPDPAVIEVFCRYLRQLEFEPEADWAGFVDGHREHAEELRLLLEQYERVTAILDRLQPAASFSARLREHYGEGIDPSISLSGDGRRGNGREESSSRSQGRVLSRLAAQNPNLSRYETRQEIARGGMGAIMEVWDRELRRTLAMKVALGARPEPGCSESTEEVAQRKLSRFLEEAQITGQLDHPGIVPVHDIGIDESARVYFTMQLIDGSDLRRVFEFARLERHGWNQRRLISVFVRVCEAMAYAHSKGVVHRDLKPANIMVGAFGEAYVMDWGLAKVLGSEAVVATQEPTEQVTKEGAAHKRSPRAKGQVNTDRSDSDSEGDAALRTLDGDIVGTPAYMAPEQARGKLEEVGPHSDIYSMGAMLYHLLSGHAPYEPLGEKVAAHTILEAVREAPPWPLRGLLPNVDGELAAICEKAMARESSLRYATMMALGEDLRAWVEGRGVSAYTTGVWYETRKWMARNKLTTIALGSIAFLLAVAIALFIYLQQSNLSKLEKSRKDTAEALLEAETAQADAAASAEKALLREAEMKKERDRADREAQDAVEAKLLAEENSKMAQIQTLAATRERARATATAYRSSINAAAFSLRLDEVEAVRRNLFACEEALRGWEWHHLHLASDASVGVSLVQEEGVTDLAVGEGGATLLTYGLGLRPRLWDVAERRMRRVDLPGPTYYRLTPQTQLERWRCALSPNGGIVAATNPADNSVRILSSRTGELLYSSVEHEAPVTAVVFSSSGNLIATASESGTVVVIDTATARVLQTYSELRGAVYALAFSPNGERLLTGGADGSARVLDIAGGADLLHLSGHHGAGVVAVDWAPAGDQVASASLDGSLAVWKADSGVMTALMHGHRGAVHDIVFSRDGQALFSAGEDRTVRMWSAETGKQLRVFNGHEKEVRAVVRLGDSDTIASCSVDGSMRFWDARWDPAKTVIEMPGRGDCNEIAFDPGGRRLLGQFDGAPVAVIDVDRATLEAPSLAPGAADVADPGARREAHTALALAAGSGRVAVATADRRVEIYSSALGSLERSVDGLGQAITRLAISHDGRRLAAGGSRRELFLIDLETGAKTRVELDSSLVALAMSPDGALVVSATSDESLHLWDASDGRSLKRHRDAHSSRIMAVAFSGDGKLLATASADRTARIWSVDDLEFLPPELGGHGEVVTALAFSSVGQRIATGTASGSLNLWSLDSHELLFRSSAHSGKILDLCFSADGTRLATTAAGGELEIWESGRGAERYDLRFGVLGATPR
jgi:WD40 repeat protein/serine/threonine protein kinase